MTDDTRAKILRAALEEFSARGFHETSVRELAERVGVTKTAVLYHFPGKADIVTALAEPMLADFEAALAQAAQAPDTRRAAVEGLLEVWLTHRYLLRMNLRDLGLTASEVVFERFRDGMLRANGLVAGPEANFADRVRAAQAIAMLSDPVVLFAEAPQAELRAAILDGVDRLFTASGGERSGGGGLGPDPVQAAAAGEGVHGGPGADATGTAAAAGEGVYGGPRLDATGTAAAASQGMHGEPEPDAIQTAAAASQGAHAEPRPDAPRTAAAAGNGEPPEGNAAAAAGDKNPHLRPPVAGRTGAAGRKGRRRGRPSAMSPETVEAARRLYDAGRAPADIAAALGVSRATIYRHLPDPN
ncbi:TetR family transcriptional regulator [Amycolatopsis sp. NPDC058278]|uniref:TetR family transcriptional regulator n=1 Tax=Amycolatopsis sp. NPDC058278 TaxID=3346417 RepID=UPI0036DACDAE